MNFNEIFRKKFMIIFKITKNHGFTLCLENAILEKLQDGEG